MLISALNTTTVVASSNIDDEVDASNQEQACEENANKQSGKQKVLAFLKDWQVIPSALLSAILIRSLIENQAKDASISCLKNHIKSQTNDKLKRTVFLCSRFNGHLLSELEYNKDAKTVVPEVLKLYTNHKAKKPAAKGEGAEIKMEDVNNAFKKDVINWLKKHEEILFQKDLALQTASFDKYEKAATEYNEAEKNVNKILNFAQARAYHAHTGMAHPDHESHPSSASHADTEMRHEHHASYPYSRE